MIDAIETTALSYVSIHAPARTDGARTSGMDNTRGPLVLAPQAAAAAEVAAANVVSSSAARAVVVTGVLFPSA
jgi:hypothetical protein